MRERIIRRRCKECKAILSDINDGDACFRHGYPSEAEVPRPNHTFTSGFVGEDAQETFDAELGLDADKDDDDLYDPMFIIDPDKSD